MLAFRLLVAVTCCALVSVGTIAFPSNCAQQGPTTCDVTPGCTPCYSDDAVDAAFVCADHATALSQQQSAITAISGLD